MRTYQDRNNITHEAVWTSLEGSPSGTDYEKVRMLCGAEARHFVARLPADAFFYLDENGVVTCMWCVVRAFFYMRCNLTPEFRLE